MDVTGWVLDDVNATGMVLDVTGWELDENDVRGRFDDAGLVLGGEVGRMVGRWLVEMGEFGNGGPGGCVKLTLQKSPVPQRQL